MMIEYLEKLVEEGKYLEAIALAERLIRQGTLTREELLSTNTTQLLAHVSTGGFESAISAGLAVVASARELKAWDNLGVAAANLGVAYSRLGNQEAAQEWFYEYLAHLPKYQSAVKNEALVWYNLGVLSTETDQEQAGAFMGRAVETAKHHGDERYAHGIRQALIQLYLRAGKWDQIPALLAKSAHYLRHNPHGGIRYRKSWLYHHQLRVEFALATGRPARALLVTIRGLKDAEGQPVHQCLFHMLLARGVYQEAPGVAIANALTAGIYAALGHASGLANQASDFILHTLRERHAAQADLQSYYQALLHPDSPVLLP